MIDVVILGGGHMGALHARVFAAAPGARVAGVFDIDHDAANRVAQQRGISTFATLTEALDAADLAVVATPIESHRALAQAALFAGCAVLVEKPVCGTAADATALVRAQKRSGRPVFVGHSERFNPVIVALRGLVGDSSVRRLELERFAPRSRASAHPVAINLAVHDVDLARAFLGGTLLVQGARGEHDEIAIDLAGGGGRATVRTSQRATVRQRSITLDLDDATYVGDLLGLSLEGPDGPVALAAAEPLALQARAIVTAMSGGPAAVATLADGVAALHLALAAEDLRAAKVRPLAR